MTLLLLLGVRAFDAPDDLSAFGVLSLPAVSAAAALAVLAAALAVLAAALIAAGVVLSPLVVAAVLVLFFCDDD